MLLKPYILKKSFTTNWIIWLDCMWLTSQCHHIIVPQLVREALSYIIHSLYKESNSIMVASNHKRASWVANQARWNKKGEITLWIHRFQKMHKTLQLSCKVSFHQHLTLQGSRIISLIFFEVFYWACNKSFCILWIISWFPWWESSLWVSIHSGYTILEHLAQRYHLSCMQ